MDTVRTAGLCFGQRYIWYSHASMPPEARYDAHIAVDYPLPEGVTLPGLRSALNYLVRRHEALRTTYHADAGPVPVQRVAPPGPLSIELVSTESDGTPGPAEVMRRLTVTEFDMEREWPIRACVITTGGRPQRLGLVLNHIAFDDWGVDTLKREFQALLTAALARKPAALPPVAAHPADLARIDITQTQDLEYWRKRVPDLPADMFAYRRDRTVSLTEAYSASLTSSHLLASARELAAGHNLWPSVVHMAAYAVTMAAYTREPMITLNLFSSHREASPHMDVMTCMFSPTLATVDLRDDPHFSEVLRRVAEQFNQAREHSRVGHDELVELLAQESFRRGQPVRAQSEWNFLSYAPRSCGIRRTRFAWNSSPTAWALSGSDTYFRVYEWADGVTIALQAMASVMDAAAVERFLRGYEQLIVKYGDMDLRVSQAGALLEFDEPCPRRFVQVGGDQVDLAAVEAVLCSHPAVRTATVAPDLRAQVEAGAVSLAELRTHFLDAMYDHPGARWPEVSLSASVSARSAPRAASSTPAEAALVTAVSRVNGIAEVDLDHCYPTAGGRVLSIPRVLAEVRTEGWTGLTVKQLASARPLRALASRMTPTAH